MSLAAKRLAAVLIAVPIALTGCSSAGEKPAPSGAASTSSAGPLAGLKAGQEVDKAVFFAATKAVADTTKTYTFSTLVGPDGTVAKSTGLVDNTDPADPKRQATITSEAGTESVLIVGGKVYSKVDAENGGKYVVSALTPELKATLGASARVDQKQDVTSKVVFVGEEELGGTKVRHFTLTTTTPGASPPASAGTATATPTVGQLDYWLDESNRPRKLQHTVDGVLSVTTYDKWGDKVTITAPTADQILSETPAATPAPTAS